MNYLERAMAMYDTLVENRRSLHQMPEIGMDLPKTREYVKKQLINMGITPIDCGGGITATIGGQRGGPVFLLRADMDALPMTEESGLDFAATGNAAHTCGHDMHTAMLLGAARLLKEDEAKLAGIVKLMFQPGEEIGQGAKTMIESGVLENPKVDAAMATHMFAMIPAGFIGYNSGIVSTSSDSFNIIIHGKSGHGAYPHNCIDPILVGAHTHMALQALISHENDPQQHTALTVGIFRAGNAYNVIPESAELSGTLRCTDEQTRVMMKKRIEEIVQMTAQTFRATAKVQFGHSISALNLSDDVVDCVGASFMEIFGRGTAKVNQRTNGSEDFAEVTARVPSACFVVGGGSPEEDTAYQYALHHPKIRFNEKGLPFGAAAFAQGAVAWLNAQMS